MAWAASGEYFENCSCDVLCPCITSPLSGPADQERCQLPFVFHIRHGHVDDVSLDGLSVIWIIDAPAIMSEGNWRVATYIDERQRAALEDLFGGRLGGVPGALNGVFGQRLGTSYVPITYHADGRTRHVEIPGILDSTIEGIVTGKEVLEITNTTHPMAANLPIAKASKGVYNDPAYSFSFDNTGKNGHYSDFDWQG